MLDMQSHCMYKAAMLRMLPAGRQQQQKAMSSIRVMLKHCQNYIHAHVEAQVKKKDSDCVRSSVLPDTITAPQQCHWPSTHM